MTTSTTTSFISSLYHGGQKNNSYNLNEPSLKAVALVVLHLHEQGLYLNCIRAWTAWEDVNPVTQTAGTFGALPSSQPLSLRSCWPKLWDIGQGTP